MRVVVATPLYPPEIGGPATYAKLLEEGLPHRGIDVTVVRFSDVRHLPKLLRHVAYWRHVRRAFLDADIALALDPVSVGLPTMLAAQSLRKPYVVKVVGDYAWEQGRQRFGVTADLDTFLAHRQPSLPVRLLQRVEARVARNAARIIVPSRYLARVLGHWGVAPEHISIIYNAVLMVETGSVPAAVASLPHPLIVTAGRLVPWKHMDEVIDAAARAGASLAVIGEGPLRETLEGHARQMLPGRSWFTGALVHADTLATISAADLFVLNSSYEGLSHLLIEAAALGKAIIATEVGGNPEVVKDGETGILVPAGDRAHLASVMASLLGNAPLRTRLGVNAKMEARRFSEAAMLDATAALLREVADPSEAMKP